MLRPLDSPYIGGSNCKLDFPPSETITPPAAAMTPLLDVEHLLKELTKEEKISLLAGRDTWSTQPIERLGIPSISVSILFLS